MPIWKNLNFKKSLAEEKFFLSYILILLAWSTIAFFFTFNNTATAISNDDLAKIATISLVAVSLQIVVLFLFQICIDIATKKYIMRLLVAIFINLNFYSFHVVFLYDFALLSTFEQIALFCTTIFIAFKFLASIGEHKLWRLSVNCGSIALVLTLGFQFHHSHSILYLDLPDNAKKITASKIKKVDFLDKPNIYILAFDALLPPDVLKGFLSIDPVKYKKNDGSSSIPNI